MQTVNINVLHVVSLEGNCLAVFVQVKQIMGELFKANITNPRLPVKQINTSNHEKETLGSIKRCIKCIIILSNKKNKKWAHELSHVDIRNNNFKAYYYQCI